jgi:hypothetical protein
LGPIADAVRALGEIREWQEAAAPATLSTSRPTQKALALTGEHHGAQAPIILELRAGLGDRSKHGRTEGVLAA